MAFNFPNMQGFVRDLIIPHIVNIRDIIKDHVNYLIQLINTTNTNLTNSINTTNTNLATEVAARTTHENDKTNPHEVRPNQIATISVSTPSSSQGVDGDLWIQYLN